MGDRIKQLEYKKEYSYYLQFDDGIEGVVDFKPYLFGDAFVEVKNLDFFKKAFVDKTTGTITWPNGIDISPETLKKSLRSKP